MAQARVLRIESKHRRWDGFLANLADFTCTAGPEVSADIVCEKPTISLYCLDDASRQAIFVETPPGIHLPSVPFVHQTQYAEAECLIAVPYDAFRHLAHQLPAIEHLIMIYSSGRSGSTLLSHVLNNVEGVVSLSEPDLPEQFLDLRTAYAQDRPLLQDLLDCALRFLFKPSFVGTRSTFAIKPRAQCLPALDLIQATFPRVKNIYLDRDLIGYVSSFKRVFLRGGAPESLPVHTFMEMFGQVSHQDLSYKRAYMDENTTELSLAEQLTLHWLTLVEWYVDLWGRGAPLLTVRYDDLNTHRVAALTAILTYCGLPSAQVPHLLGVFDRDAQAGTFRARETPSEGNQLRLTEADLAAISRILQRHPLVKSPEYVLPGTLQF